jgi:hypothetical protein
MDSLNTDDKLKDCLDKCHRLIEEAETIRAVQVLDVSDDIELEKEISASIKND